MTKVKTTKRDLRGGTSLWGADPSETIGARTAARHEKCDVAVIGAGVSGALVGMRLAREGLDVVVVDRRTPGLGSTVASTAMIQFEIDTPLTELADKIGAKKAERAYLRAFKAVTSLGRIISETELDCSWMVRKALYLAGNEMGHRGLKEEAEYRARIGLPSEFLTGRELRDSFEFDRTGAILSGHSAELNPFALTLGLLRNAKHNGARLYSGHEISQVICTASGVTLAAETSGLTIEAKKAVFATGYETLPQIPKGRYDIISSWAIATQPLPEAAFWPTKCLVWEASDPYLYIRATADGRILAGGEDAAIEDAGRRDKLIGQKSKKLLAKLNDLLPGRKFAIDFAWAGAFADSPTGLPVIGEIDTLPNCLALLGCGGNGITFSVIAADIVASWVRGKRDPDADLFD